MLEHSFFFSSCLFKVHAYQTTEGEIVDFKVTNIILLPNIFFIKDVVKLHFIGFVHGCEVTLQSKKVLEEIIREGIGSLQMPWKLKVSLETGSLQCKSLSTTSVNNSKNFLERINKSDNVMWCKPWESCVREPFKHTSMHLSNKVNEYWTTNYLTASSLV